MKALFAKNFLRIRPKGQKKIILIIENILPGATHPDRPPPPGVRLCWTCMPWEPSWVHSASTCTWSGPCSGDRSPPSSRFASCSRATKSGTPLWFLDANSRKSGRQRGPCWFSCRRRKDRPWYTRTTRGHRDPKPWPENSHSVFYFFFFYKISSIWNLKLIFPKRNHQIWLVAKVFL